MEENVVEYALPALSALVTFWSAPATTAQFPVEIDCEVEFVLKERSAAKAKSAWEVASSSIDATTTNQTDLAFMKLPF